MMKKRKKSDNYEKRPIDRIINGAFYLLCGFFLLVCALLLFATKGHCQDLPVYVDNEQFVGVYGLDAQGFVSAFNNSRYAQNNGLSMSLDVPGTFLINGTENGYNYTCIYVPTTSYSGDFSTANGVTYNTWNSEDNTLSLSSTYTYYLLYERGELWQAQLYYYAYNQANLTVTFYGQTGLDIGYLTSNYNWGVDPSKIIATNETVTVIPIGHATPPHEFDSPIFTTGHTPPSQVPQLTINHYTWTNTPTPDLTTLENAVNSIFDYLTWLGENLKNMLTNIVNNIQSVGQFIGETIQYFGGLIISNIQNMVQTFYNNMVSLFESVAQAIDYISQPLDINELTNTVNTTQIFDDVDTCTSYANDAFGIYGTVSEPNSFKIPLDLRSISLLNITQVYYIDLSWLDGAKSAIRAFMWCVVTFGLLYSVIVDIPNMIRSSK